MYVYIYNIYIYIYIYIYICIYIDRYRYIDIDIDILVVKMYIKCKVPITKHCFFIKVCFFVLLLCVRFSFALMVKKSLAYF